ncbi:MAG TPA: amidohydrolase family protein [Methylomirabilota bacterium]|nr:amidohydrolase family protein [Methylomirabilota bacterium]
MDLSAIPLYDHHAHALFGEAAWRGAPLEPYFSEAEDADQLSRFGRDTLNFRRGIRDLAGFYGCAPGVDAVLEARRRADYGDLVRRMFAEARIGHWLVDDGLWTDQLLSLGECAALVPGVPVRRIMRLEVELATLVEQHDRAGSLLTAFAERVTKLAPDVAAFKSIAAYRSGLEIGRHASAEVESAFTAVRRAVVPGTPPRLVSKPLIDTMLWTVLPIAAAARRPVQFHTGFGDPHLDLRLANPLHLRPLFEARELRGLAVVFLHSYPFVREAGYLASVYPGAYVDLGLTVPYASVHAMRTALHEAMHLAPVTKVLLSTDAQRTPETFWLAARWGRRVLGEVLEAAVADGDLARAEAEWAAARILNENAAALYG